MVRYSTTVPGPHAAQSLVHSEKVNRSKDPVFVIDVPLLLLLRVVLKAEQTERHRQCRHQPHRRDAPPVAPQPPLSSLPGALGPRLDRIPPHESS